MSLMDSVLDAVKTGFPGFVGSSVFAVVSKPKSVPQGLAILVCGLSVSQIFTTPLAEHYNLVSFVGPLGFGLGFCGMALAQMAVVLLDALKALAPSILDKWIHQKLDLQKKADDKDDSNGPN